MRIQSNMEQLGFAINCEWIKFAHVTRESAESFKDTVYLQGSIFWKKKF